MAENQPPSTIVAWFATMDPNQSDDHHYSLVAGSGDTDNALFVVDGVHLRTASSLDAEAFKAGYATVRVRSTDPDGFSIETELRIWVRNFYFEPNLPDPGGPPFP